MRPGPARSWTDLDLRADGEQPPGAVVVHYQPVVDLTSDAVVGVEALLRLTGPGGLRRPADFLDAAERDGSLVELGYCLMHHAFAEVRRWQDRGHGDVRLLVNASPAQLAAPGFAARVTALLQVSRLAPAALVLEITEGMPLTDHPGLPEVLEELAGTGIGLALDDFGTGYGSLLELRDLPLVGVKLDQRFVAGLPDDVFDAAVLDAVRGLADARGLWCVAEGVERPAQRDALLAAGLVLAQGHLMSRAVPARELDRVLVDLR